MKKLLASLSVSVILSGGFVTEKANAKDVTDSDQIVTVNNNSDAARSVSPRALQFGMPREVGSGRRSILLRGCNSSGVLSRP